MHKPLTEDDRKMLARLQEKRNFRPLTRVQMLQYLDLSRRAEQDEINKRKEK